MIEQKEKKIDMEEGDCLMVAPVKQGIPTSISELPPEILMDILSRLPIKCVGFCRCVSKPWRHLATNPQFTKMHLSRSSPGLIIQHIDLPINSPNKFYFVESENHFESTPRHDLGMEFKAFNSQLNSSDLQVQITGSCNGLLCLHNALSHGDPVYICNPLIGEYMTLPKNKKETVFNMVTGFGLDPITDQYKVVRMVYTNVKGILEGEIYTIGSGSWRNLGEIPYPIKPGFSTAFLNGNLHWKLDEHRHIESCRLICSFDIHEETFQTLPLPPVFVKKEVERYMYLMELRGNLCIGYSFNDRIEIWMMMEYGINESWSRKYVIEKPIVDGIELPFRPPMLRIPVEPIRISKNDDILLKCHYRDFLSYDPVQRVHTNPRIYEILGLRNAISDANSHLASLVSLKDIIMEECVRKRKGWVRYGKWSTTLYPIPSHQQGRRKFLSAIGMSS